MTLVEKVALLRWFIAFSLFSAGLIVFCFAPSHAETFSVFVLMVFWFLALAVVFG